MRNALRTLVHTAVAIGALTVMAGQALAAEAASSAPQRYSVAMTAVGQLLDDPAANAVLKKMIPTVYANEMFQTQGRELTLKSIQQFEPEALSDENLAKIQLELDKLPVKK